MIASWRFDDAARRRQIGQLYTELGSVYQVRPPVFDFVWGIGRLQPAPIALWRPLSQADVQAAGQAACVQQPSLRRSLPTTPPRPQILALTVGLALQRAQDVCPLLGIGCAPLLSGALVRALVHPGVQLPEAIQTAGLAVVLAVRARVCPLACTCALPCCTCACSPRRVCPAAWPVGRHHLTLLRSALRPPLCVQVLDQASPWKDGALELQLSANDRQARLAARLQLCKVCHGTGAVPVPGVRGASGRR